MNWEAASAIAEWIGVILIIISLIHVALQIRQNTETIFTDCGYLILWVPAGFGSAQGFK